MSKYFRVSLQKEEVDTDKLIQIIKEDGWFDRSTIIVNCSPEYSSRLSQTLNHRLSHMNKNELFEVIDLPMPLPNSNQVWNPITKTFDIFDPYLKKWCQDNVFSNKFLFVSVGTLRGKNFNKVKLSVRPHLDNEMFRFASLYVQDDSILVPDYYVEKFNKKEQGGLLFQWENMDNPNWDY